MDGHDGADAVIERVVLKDGVQEDGHDAGLPVVAVDDVGMEPNGRQDGQRGLGEEAELFDVPMDVAVRLGATEIVLVVDEIVGNAVKLIGQDADIDRTQAAKIHVKMRDIFKIVAVPLGDGHVIGDDHTHIKLLAVKGLGQCAHDVGQAAGLDERDAFGCDEQDIFHK